MEVSPEELQECMQRPGPRAFRLVDVRNGDDFLISRLDWAELIPLEKLGEEAPRRLVDKNEPVVLYCRDGKTSQLASEQLSGQGYEFVLHLAGGLEAWVKKVDPNFLLAGKGSAPAPAEAPSSPSPLEAPTARPAMNFNSGEVSPEELRSLMNRPEPRDFRLIDVREEDEFQICRLDWAELIPLSQLSEQAPRRLVDKDRPIIVYCHHGMRSARAAEWLRKVGYEHVFNLVGGIEAWADRVDPGMRRY